MASKRQRALDRLIESSGARVYDEEAGCWSDGSDDESGWGLSSITNAIKKGVGTSWKIATTPYSLARRAIGMSRSSSPQPAYQQAYQPGYQPGYQPQPYQQSYQQPYQDPGYQQPYQDPGYQDPGYAQDYYPDQG